MSGFSVNVEGLTLDQNGVPVVSEPLENFVRETRAASSYAKANSTCSNTSACSNISCGESTNATLCNNTRCRGSTNDAGCSNDTCGYWDPN